MGLKPVTSWARQTKVNGPVELNHLEDGWCLTDTPTPKCDEHKKVWKGGTWFKKFMFLDDNYVLQEVVDVNATVSG